MSDGVERIDGALIVKVRQGDRMASYEVTAGRDISEVTGLLQKFLFVPLKDDRLKMGDEPVVSVCYMTSSGIYGEDRWYLPDGDWSTTEMVLSPVVDPVPGA